MFSSLLNILKRRIKIFECFNEVMISSLIKPDFMGHGIQRSIQYFPVKMGKCCYAHEAPMKSRKSLAAEIVKQDENIHLMNIFIL